MSDALNKAVEDLGQTAALQAGEENFAAFQVKAERSSVPMFFSEKIQPVCDAFEYLYRSKTAAKAVKDTFGFEFSEDEAAYYLQYISTVAAVKQANAALEYKIRITSVNGNYLLEQYLSIVKNLVGSCTVVSLFVDAVKIQNLAEEYFKNNPS